MTALNPLTSIRAEVEARLAKPQELRERKLLTAAKGALDEIWGVFADLCWLLTPAEAKYGCNLLVLIVGGAYDNKPSSMELLPLVNFVRGCAASRVSGRE